MAVTIKDVARETNLAISTISKYMNGGTVRPENKDLIEKAVEKLGYHPNNAARGLRNARTFTIGILIHSLENQFFAKIAAHVERLLKLKGYNLILCCHRDEPEKADSAIAFLADKRVDGIIIVPIRGCKLNTSTLAGSRIPIVAIDRPMEGFESDYVMSNSATGVYQAVEYLIQMGHREIGIIAGGIGNHKQFLKENERLRGYLRALEDYGMPVSAEYIYQGDDSFASGFKLMGNLWEKEKHPTALMVSNYNMSLGAVTRIHNLKIAIPGELSFVAFDDLEFSVISKPSLTAVRQPVEQIAERALDILFRRIGGDYEEFPQKIKLATKLMERESVQNLKGSG